MEEMKINEGEREADMRNRLTSERKQMRQADGWKPHPGLLPLSSSPAQFNDKQARRKSSIISTGHEREDDRCFLQRRNL